MTKIDVTQVLMSFDGKPLEEIRKEGEDNVDLTLRFVLLQALGHNTKAERTNGVDSVGMSLRFARMIEVQTIDSVEYTAEDIADFKTRITELYQGALVIGGSALKALDPPSD